MQSYPRIFNDVIGPAMRGSSSSQCAASNAVSCANMALSDYNHLIPLDEVIETMQSVGNQIHHRLRCTNLGGLSVTKTAKAIEQRLEKQTQTFYKIC